jgi:hypothetical protein
VPSREAQLRVAHETVLVQNGGQGLHVLALSRDEKIEGLDGLGHEFAAAAPAVRLDDLKRLSDLIVDRARAPWWLGETYPLIGPSAQRRATKQLVGALTAIKSEPVFARAALTSLVARSTRPPEQRGSDVPHDLQYVAAALRDQLRSELEFDAAQLDLMLGIAIDTVWAERSGADGVIVEYERYEIPFALSPEIKAARLKEIIGGARMLALVPLGSGAIDATAALEQTHFLAAGEFAVGGALISIVLCVGVAAAERTLAWGRRRPGQ